MPKLKFRIRMKCAIGLWVKLIIVCRQKCVNLVFYHTFSYSTIEVLTVVVNPLALGEYRNKPILTNAFLVAYICVRRKHIMLILINWPTLSLLLFVRSTCSNFDYNERLCCFTEHVQVNGHSSSSDCRNCCCYHRSADHVHRQESPY